MTSYCQSVEKNLRPALLILLGLGLSACGDGSGSGPTSNAGPNNGETIVLPGVPIVIGDVAGPVGTQTDATVLREIEVPVAFPEGIVYHDGTNAFYGGGTVAGAIYKARLDGTAELFMAPGKDGAGTPDLRTAVQGLNVDQEDRLYIAGGPSAILSVYQLPEGSLAARFLLPPGAYINDVAIAPDGDVYVTDSLLPNLYRFTAAQVAAGGGLPQVIAMLPEVKYLDKTRDLNPFEANGIRVTPDGRFVLFVSTNDHVLYRLNELDGAPAVTPIVGSAGRTIVPVAIEDDFGDGDGMEMVDFNTVYLMDNNGEAINRIELFDDYTRGRIVSQARSERFHTPTGVTRAPDDTLLVTNAELFDMSEPLAPFFVIRTPRF